jgi:hypothetical protein
MTDDTHLSSGIAATDNLRVRTFDIAELEERVSGWHELPKHERKHLLKTGEIDPQTDETHSNTTTTALHTTITQALVGGSLPAIDKLVLGDDWGGGSEPSDSAFQASDTNLNSFVDAFSTADAASDGATYLVDVLLGSLEYDGVTFREWGLRFPFPGGELVNHGPIYDGSSALEKQDGEAALLTATLTFGDVSDASGGSL